MSVVARFVLPADAFVLGEVLTPESSGQIRLESVIPTGDGTIPYFWVSTDEADDVYAVLEESSLIEEVKLVDRVRDETLFRVRWRMDDGPVLDALDVANGALLEAWGDGDDWVFHIRFDEQASVSVFYQACVDAGVTPTLSELHSYSSVDTKSGMGLTGPQLEALESALDSGYYAVPREITLQELAASLGISDTALSQRLRRGLTTLLSSSIRSSSTLTPERFDVEVEAEQEDDE